MGSTAGVGEWLGYVTCRKIEDDGGAGQTVTAMGVCVVFWVVITEVARIIEDIENDMVDATLARLGAEDVELDMDDIYVHQDDNLLDNLSEGTVDGQ